jgi:hypothetical protein
MTDFWVSTVSNITGYTENLEQHGASVRVMKLHPVSAQISTQT